jgi:hypothetical protein
MADIEAIEVLTRAKERIMDHGWGRGNVVYRDMGHRDKGEYRTPGTYCLEDALCGRGHFLSQFNPTEVRVSNYLRRATGYAAQLWKWNDQQDSPTPVLNAIDDAILIAKEAQVVS